MPDYLKRSCKILAVYEKRDTATTNPIARKMPSFNSGGAGGVGSKRPITAITPVIKVTVVSATRRQSSVEGKDFLFLNLSAENSKKIEKASIPQV